MITDHRAGGLVIFRLAVLARQSAWQEVVLALVLSHGGEVFTCEHGNVGRVLPTPPERRVLREMLRVFIQLERDVRAVRSRTRRQRKTERGGYAGGAPPYGFRAEAHTLTVDTAEQAALRRMVELRQAGASLREIAHILTLEGYRPKRAEHWHPESLRRILARLTHPDP